jgi:hypothetical protein
MRTVGRREVVITRGYTKARERLPHYHREIDEKLELFCQNRSIRRYACTNWITRHTKTGGLIM